MMTFVEPLVTQHLWHWLESEKDWIVDSEIDTGNGRIDLACRTGSGEYIGIEVKAGSGLSYHSRLPVQLWRYMDSGMFDAVYFASPEIEEAAARLGSSTSEPVRGIVRHVTRKLRGGVQEGRYEAEEVFDRIKHEVDDNILSAEIERQKSTGPRPIRDFIWKDLNSEAESSLESVTIDAGIQELSRSILPPALGLIEVPLPLDEDLLQSPEKALKPGGIKDPEVECGAVSLSRNDAPSFTPREEPQIRHAVWLEYGGLPEGVIPNVMESEQRERPIDLIAFEGAHDPAKIYQDSDSGDVIGVEVKGISSYSPKRLTSQLKEYLATEVFSRLYLAVPFEDADRAYDLILNRADLFDRVGLLAVEKDGTVTVEKEAATLDVRHDGYKCGNEIRKTGFGDIQVEGGEDASSPFVLSEWREPLTDPDGKPVVWNYDPRKTDHVIRDLEELNVTKHELVDRRLKSKASEASTARSYLLKGYSADPYVKGKRTDGGPRFGFVRLSVTGFDTEDRGFGLALHFGRGNREGGYICIVGDRIDALVSILSSLEHIEGGKVGGQGKYIDLATFQGTRDQKLYEHGESSEQLLQLRIHADREEGEVGALFQIARDRGAGVEVRMTEIQRIDLLRTIRTLRFGRPSEIPGWEVGNHRIGPNGNDTWDWGTGVEKVHKPDRLEPPLSP